MTRPLLYDEIDQDSMNASFHARGWPPVYTASPRSRIVLVGQAPGRIAQETRTPWNDASGRTLRQWLGVTDEQFYDPDLFALMPMDFYFPGRGKTGDLPPRKFIAEDYHEKMLALMPKIKLTILIGEYAIKNYLKDTKKENLTETVRCFQEYLPKYFPIVHPSPLNFRWQAKNPWFEKDVVPMLRQKVHEILG